MQRLWLLLSVVLCAGCIPVAPKEPVIGAPPQNLPAPEERTEKIDMIDLKEVFSGTGALTERLLPTGILDMGERDAPVTLLLFTEHHAKYCREFQQDQFPRLYKDFIERGLLRFQIVAFPLKKYPQSHVAAAGMLCAAEQGKGMAMHAVLSERLDKERRAPSEYAEELNLDPDQFDECMEDDATQMILDQQKSFARSLDVSLVPTFFLNGEKLVGLPYYPDLRGMIEKKLE